MKQKLYVLYLFGNIAKWSNLWSCRLLHLHCSFLLFFLSCFLDDFKCRQILVCCKERNNFLSCYSLRLWFKKNILPPPCYNGSTCGRLQTYTIFFLLTFILRISIIVGFSGWYIPTSGLSAGEWVFIIKTPYLIASQGFLTDYSVRTCNFVQAQPSMAFQQLNHLISFIKLRSNHGMVFKNFPMEPPAGIIQADIINESSPWQTDPDEI